MIYRQFALLYKKGGIYLFCTVIFPFSILFNCVQILPFIIGCASLILSLFFINLHFISHTSRLILLSQQISSLKKSTENSARNVDYSTSFYSLLHSVDSVLYILCKLIVFRLCSDLFYSVYFLYSSSTIKDR